jgi:hypothetical protein
VGLQVREQPEFGWGQRRSAGHSLLRARCEDLAKLRDFVDEGAKSGPVEQDVVDLTHQVACGPLVASGRVRLGQPQSHARGDAPRPAQ